MEISDLIKSARIEKGLTQQQLADVVFVTRQTISKWELGKSVPDQASLILLYQYLDIKDNEKKQLSKLIFNKQNIILILIAILFSPMVIGVRFICCKIDKIENRKIKAVIKVIGFVVFSSYLVSLKENVAYLLIGIFSLVYLLYQFYLSGLALKFNINNPGQCIQIELVESYYFVQTIDEFGRKRLIQSFCNHAARVFFVISTDLGGKSDSFSEFFQLAGSNIRCHDDYGIFKVYSSAITVSQPTFIHHLQQYVEYIGMRFFNFIQ